MSALTCGCPGDPGRSAAPCPSLATQEDLLCDTCRLRDCPTVTDENWAERNARAGLPVGPQKAPF